MDIMRRIENARGLTPTEQQLASTARSLGPRLQGYSIKEFAVAAHVSIPSVHRFCKKIGLEGFKELKVEFARAQALREHRSAAVDINFPFLQDDDAETVLESISAVYESTLRDTRELLDPAAMDRTAGLFNQAGVVDIYTQSHNLYPAQMFCNRLLSCGHAATCHEGLERQTWSALASDASHAALLISYSGLGPNLATLLPILADRKVPAVLIGTPRAERLNPGLAAYLHVSDQESLQDRITQFASHIAVQYVLDSLFGCMLALDWERGSDFLSRSLPHTSLPALPAPRLTPVEYAGIMMNRMR